MLHWSRFIFIECDFQPFVVWCVVFSMTEEWRAGTNALHRAVLRGDIKAIQIELDKAAQSSAIDERTRDIYKKTPLMLTIANVKLEACKLLLERRADLSAKDWGGWTALHLCSSSEDSAKFAELLLEARAPIDEKGGQGGMTVLMLAAARGDASLIQLLLARRADLNARTGGTRALTALDVATPHVRHLLVQPPEPPPAPFPRIINCQPSPSGQRCLFCCFCV